MLQKNIHKTVTKQYYRTRLSWHSLVLPCCSCCFQPQFEVIILSVKRWQNYLNKWPKINNHNKILQKKTLQDRWSIISGEAEVPRWPVCKYTALRPEPQRITAGSVSLEWPVAVEVDELLRWWTVLWTVWTECSTLGRQCQHCKLSRGANAGGQMNHESRPTNTTQ